MVGFYVVGAWLVIQVADVFFPAWGLPETALRFLIIALILCFPIALIFSWTFDITTSGIVKTEPAEAGEIFDNSLKRTDYFVLVALLSIGAAIVFSSLQRIVEEVDDAVAVAEKIDNSVAVLPFANLDTNPETGYFSDGVTEEILHRLSSIKALHILSRTSSFAFRNSNEGPARISELLGVRYLLHGSVRRDNNFVRVTARLIDDTGYQVWSETFDRKLEGIFAIQSEIANTVASRIERQIIPLAELPAGRTTTNMEAYDAYLVGRSFLNARTTAGWRQKAFAAFEEAIRLDENYAPPYAGLAMALELDYFNDDRVAARESAVRAAETAIKLDPELAEGHAALGLILMDDAITFGDTENKLERAERSLRRALDLDPTLSNAYNWLSITLFNQGRYEEANAVQEQGLLVDPLSPVLTYNIARQLKRLGERERAEQLLLRLTYLPDPPGAAYLGMVELYRDTGHIDKSLQWAKEAALIFYDWPPVADIVAGLYEYLGLTEDADNWMADGLGHTPQPADRFISKAIQFQRRGDLAGMRAEIDKLRTALGSDIDGLQIFHTAVYAAANIYVENFNAGIDALEKAFDLESLSKVNELKSLEELESLHLLAYAYQKVGRIDEANVLLTQLHEQLNTYVVERNMDFGPLHHLFAQNFGLRGDFDAAADALEAAIKAGWLRHIWVMNDPTWAETITHPRIARMLDDVKVELERQRALVEQADAEHDFRAEFAAKRSTLGD
jgi:TolB-like protein/tetratricopeptide (TPR) repeat protein